MAAFSFYCRPGIFFNITTGNLFFAGSSNSAQRIFNVLKGCVKQLIFM